VSRRRAAAADTSFGLGLTPVRVASPAVRPMPAPTPLVASAPLPPPKPRPRPAPVRIAPQPVQPEAPVVSLPATPWGRIAAECPDHRSVDAHELPADRWTCACGWIGSALRGHRCGGVTVLDRLAWVHVTTHDGGPVQCVPGTLARVLRWTTVEPGRAGVERHVHETPLACPRFEPVDGRGAVTAAYSAAEASGRRACADAPTVTERRACGCSPAGLCVVARALVERIDERRRLRDAGADAPRAVWRHAHGLTETVLRAHLRGVALTCVRGMWRAVGIRG
jgi:hypothetical protein